ncbi:phospholipid carrier-dependent glycosyltransferase [Flavobacteriaceae bacterium Ap0902]|nr:phospholipid carrier-dependent glycosyltransferase [Flavobacteriaceae bacterium Ap0902]
MISNKTYTFLYVLWAVVIGFGLFIPLMENDSAQHATMAMQMAKNHNYLEIYKGLNPYLDKPQMHFWLSAFSFEIFGFHPWAYRIPAILLTLFSSYGLYQLGTLLYHDKHIGHLSALIFLSSFAIILSLHDVRTDAVLVAFTILACWQWTKFLHHQTLLSAMLGGLFAAFAYSTKGMFAVAIIGLFLFYLVLFQNRWKQLFNYKLLVGILFFLIGSAPMFYAYYHQFGTEGLEFITYGQSTGRFKGEDFGTASQNDYAFYFHTLLWAMIPWGLWFYYSLFLKSKNCLSKDKKQTEIITAATVLTFIIGMNFSAFKLPHYLNIVLPFASIMVAGTSSYAYMGRKHSLIRLFSITQYISAAIIAIGVILLMYAFPIHSWWIGLLLILCLARMLFLYKTSKKYDQIMLISAGTFLIAAIYLNSTFYPSLLAYQGNLQFAKIIQEEQIPADDIYNLSPDNTWSIDWQVQRTVAPTTIDQIPPNKSDFWAIIKEENPETYLGPDYEILEKHKTHHYRITRLKLGFLNPETRDDYLEHFWLVHVRRK